MRKISSRPDRPDPLFEGIAGFVWTLTASLLVMGGGTVVALAVGTHLLIRRDPQLTQIVNYDPSAVATLAVIPVLAGLTLLALYLVRLRHRAGTTA